MKKYIGINNIVIVILICHILNLANLFVNKFRIYY